MRTSARNTTKKSTTGTKKYLSLGTRRNSVANDKNKKASSAKPIRRNTEESRANKTEQFGAGLNKLFLKELGDMHNSENQIVKALPKMIRLASSNDLKTALTNHLKETKEQVKRIKRIFSVLGVSVKDVTCEAMEGLLKEANELVGKHKKSPLLDATIISAGQKIEHYEMASYGTLRSFAQHLDLEQEIIDLLQETLDEEGAADKKLTKIAEGSLFFGGINKEAAKLTRK